MASENTLALRNRVPEPATMGTHKPKERKPKDRKLSRRQKRLLRRR